MLTNQLNNYLEQFTVRLEELIVAHLVKKMSSSLEAEASLPYVQD
jgi:hypothetical protein